MTDNLTPTQRRHTMRRVRSNNTRPELAVRAALRRLGQSGYRLHRKDIPGRPDIAFIGRKIAIFVHGCFWHGHNCRRGDRLPASNRAYWPQKIERNKKRDAANLAELQRRGWRTTIIWECRIKDAAWLHNELAAVFDDKRRDDNSSAPQGDCKQP